MGWFGVNRVVVVGEEFDFVLYEVVVCVDDVVISVLMVVEEF